MHLDWITDPHLDHLPDEQALISFVKKLHARPSDGLLVTGDIAESNTIYDYLGILSGAYQRPVYFVLGNHDYYRGWIDSTRESVRRVCRAVPKGILNWMPDAGPIMLDKQTAIVGHGGFYDGQEGEPGLQMQMSDFHLPHGVHDLIQEISYGSRYLFDKLRELGNEGAESIAEQTRRARYEGAERVLILTHVPPFLEASYFRGKPSSDKAAPFYVNRCLGMALLELAHQFPTMQFEVFAGHTHGKREYWPTENMVVRVGSARYGRQPVFQPTVEV